MKYISLDPKKSEPFKSKMAESGWPINHQDVGQTEILAYGYVIVWQKDDKKVNINIVYIVDEKNRNTKSIFER